MIPTMLKPFKNVAYPCYLLQDDELYMNEAAQNSGLPLSDEKTILKLLQASNRTLAEDNQTGTTTLPLLTNALSMRNLTLMKTSEGLLAVAQDEKEAPVVAFSSQMRELLANIFATLPLINLRLDGIGHRYVEEVQANTYQLLRLASNLENAHSIENHRFEMQTVDLSSLVASLCYCADSVCREQKVPIGYSVPDMPLPVKADPRLLSNAILNLLRNSVQFTRDGNEVQVTVAKAGNRAIITVEDKGLGILPENLAHVFDPYFSEDPYGDSEANPGLGLGLPVVREAVSGFGGTVNIESRFGEGTRCHIALPLHYEAEEMLSSETSDYLLNRYSPVYIQLCGFCRLPVV